MTINQLVQSQQQRRIEQLSQGRQGAPHVNPYGTPGMSLNHAGDYRKLIQVDSSVAQQVKQIAHQRGNPGIHHEPGA